MAEFAGLHRDESTQSFAQLLDAGTCRFCGSPTGDASEVCGHSECQSHAAAACTQVQACGHLCGGIKSEAACLGCLRCPSSSRRQDGDDLCVVCFTDRLGAAPSLKLQCGHLFHAHCLKATLTRRWPGPRIGFAFMKCPICQTLMEHAGLEELLKPLRALYEEVAEKARMRLEYDQASSSAQADPVTYALERYVYVQCWKCSAAYFGGEAGCGELASSAYNPEELLCGRCSDVAAADLCPRHGAEFLEYKCRYCCSVAVFFCFGTTHFCAGCHDDFTRLLPIPVAKLPPCPAAPKAQPLGGDACPLKVQHPPTGQEYALGCGVCRNLRTF